MPAFIDIGQRFDLGEGEELKAFHTAGFLGSEYGPFIIPNPDEAVKSVRPPAGHEPGPFRTPRQASTGSSIAQSPIGQLGSDYQQESLLRSLDNAHRLLSSPAAKAFDLSLEPKASYDKYNTRPVRPRLPARPAADRGRRALHRGHHRIHSVSELGHARKRPHPPGRLERNRSTRPIAQLVLDLEERGLLDRTLIVLASEFSRDMMIEGKPDNAVKDQVAVPDVINELKYYGMHRHFTDAGSVLMFGGGSEKRLSPRQDGRRTPLQDIEQSAWSSKTCTPRSTARSAFRPSSATKSKNGPSTSPAMAWANRSSNCSPDCPRSTLPAWKADDTATSPKTLLVPPLRQFCLEFHSLLQGPIRRTVRGGLRQLKQIQPK